MNIISDIAAVDETVVEELAALRRQVVELNADRERATRSLQDLARSIADVRAAEKDRAERVYRSAARALLYAQAAARAESYRRLSAELRQRAGATSNDGTSRGTLVHLTEDVDELAGSPLFSAEYYLKQNPDVAATGMQPIEHFSHYGWRELRRPHPLFDTAWYLQAYPEVLSADINPLLHYLRRGEREDRRPNPVFDSRWYLAVNTDVAMAGVDPLAHYITDGAAEQRNPHPLFDAGWYARTYDVDVDVPWRPLAHFLDHGLDGGFKPSDGFDPLQDIARCIGQTDGSADALTRCVEKHLVNLLQCSQRVGTTDSSAVASSSPTDLASFFPALSHQRQGPERRHAEALRFGKIGYVGLGNGNPSFPYRVTQKAEVLAELGYSVHCIGLAQLIDSKHLLSAFDVIVFARVDYAAVQWAIELCRANGCIVAFDIDDYVFDPAVANPNYVDGLRDIPPKDYGDYYYGVLAYRRMILSCDVTFVTTEKLRRAVAQLGKPAIILPNSASAETVALSEVARLDREERLPSQSVVIGFASGTKTHQRDFRVALPGIVHALATFPQARLKIVGQFDLKEFPELSPYRLRIVQAPLVPPSQLPSEYASFDINIAPLEVGNPYCEAKSALKHLEAALAGVPTIASATEPFRRAVKDGVTGLLARTQDEWADGLALLISDRRKAAAMAEAARQEVLHILRRRHDATVGDVFANLIAARLRGDLNLPSRLFDDVEQDGEEVDVTVGRRPLKIGWVIPGLIIGGGGHRNILRAAYHLQSFGHDVGLYFCWTDQSPDELRELVHKHFYPFEGRVAITGEEFSGYDDVVFATHNGTVDLAVRMTGVDAHTFYFVQDFEPLFTPMSSDYIRAENTYRRGLYAITSGPWCAKVLRRSFGMQADFFRFPVDRAIYYPRPDVARSNRIIFFAKPDMPRRCFELGAEALRHVHSLRPDIEIVFFGGRGAAKLIDYPVQGMDIVPTIDDLAVLYASAKVGVAFSTTNPSLIPYEMMACGLPVVDLDRNDNDANYDDRRDIAFLADPEPAIMARQIIALYDNESERQKRSQNGLAFVAKFPSELEMAHRVDQLIAARLQAVSHDRRSSE